MVLKIVFVIAAVVIACVQAGGPAAYAISAPSVDHGSVGNSQEHTVKGHYGQSSQSDYSSSVNTGHSQSHVQRSSTSNDAGYAPANYGVAAAAPAVAHAYAAPIASYAAPTYAAHNYVAPVTAYAAHGYSGHGYTAPSAISHGYGIAASAPAYAAHSYAAPAITYAAPATISHGISHGYPAAPVYASHSYATPAVKVAAAPAYAAPYYGHGVAAHGLGYPAHYAAPAPAYAPAHYAAPFAVKAAVAAPALVHTTSVAGHGVHYAY